MKKSPKARARTALMDPIPVTEQVVIGIMRAGWALESRLDKFASTWGITLMQFNVIRICYVRDPENLGIPSGTIGAALAKRVPDVSRLLDRLVKAGLIERAPAPDDRRVVLIRLTTKGFDLVEKIHAPLLEHNRALFEHLTEAEQQRLANGLARAFEGPLSKRSG